MEANNDSAIQFELKWEELKKQNVELVHKLAAATERAERLSEQLQIAETLVDQQIERAERAEAQSRMMKSAIDAAHEHIGRLMPEGKP